jgi:DNA mismatch repair protein MutS2
MTSTERDIARFLSDLHSRLDRVAELEADLQKRIDEAQRREASLQREFERREAAKIRELEERNDRLVAQFESNARETIENIVQSAESRKAAEQASRKVAKTRREFREAFAGAVREAAPEAAPKQPDIQEGARVVLKGVRSPARVRRILGDDMIEVEAGFMKMQVSRDDVDKVLPPEAEQPRLPHNVSFHQAGPRWDVPYSEINVIGKRAEEAIDEIDRFLDHAALAGVVRVRIVHGHGMNVLKKAVGAFLRKSPHVEKFYPAGEQEGGTGATIAELKQ